MSDVKVPSITIKIADKEKFHIEVVKEHIPTPNYALCMIDTARRAIDQERQDLEAIEFQQKMQMVASAQRAMTNAKIKM
jgi:hypothetical protein